MESYILNIYQIDNASLDTYIYFDGKKKNIIISENSIEKFIEMLKKIKDKNIDIEKNNNKPYDYTITDKVYFSNAGIRFIKSKKPINVQNETIDKFIDNSTFMYYTEANTQSITIELFDY